MGLLDWFRTKQEPEMIEEALKPFERKTAKIEKDPRKRYGEGIEDFTALGTYYTGSSNELNSFNTFHKKYIDVIFENEVQKITEYRNIARYPEIAEVLEDAVNESTQLDTDGNLIRLQIVDEELAKNSNIVKNLEAEFEKLFYKRLDIVDKIEDLMTTYFVDGRLYLENVIDIDHPNKGIINIKRLSTESMDFMHNPFNNNPDFFVQYIGSSRSLPKDIETAKKENKKCIVFYPSQITYIDYGQYGKSGKKEVLGYLEKVKAAYNQVKLLETSIVIYRLVRAPERLVFKIDTGEMPPTKAMKYVESVKNSMQKKVTYDPSTGKTTNEPNVLSLLENYFLASSSSGRGSSIETIGGNPSGFAELDDLYYFQNKLYRALKYPMSRIESMHQKDTKSVLFAESGGEIARDETKWGRFLSKHQQRFAEAFLDLFCLHLDFIGIATQYGINRSKLQISFTTPNDYIARQQNTELSLRRSNYNDSASDEFSYYWRMKEYLKLTDAEIQANAEGFKKDVELGLRKEEGGSGSNW